MDASTLKEISATLSSIKAEYVKICKTFLKDNTIKSRTVNVATISKEEAQSYSMVGPFARASGVDYDVRSLGKGAYGDLSDFSPVIDDQGDCYARIKVRAAEVLQSIDIINELISKIPDGDIFIPIKANLDKDAEISNVLEQPRGECFYYGCGNGTKFLERFRIRTPTSQNLAGMIGSLKGCDLADVNMIVLTIDPCISCTER